MNETGIETGHTFVKIKARIVNKRIGIISKKYNVEHTFWEIAKEAELLQTVDGFDLQRRLEVRIVYAILLQALQSWPYVACATR